MIYNLPTAPSGLNWWRVLRPDGTIRLVSPGEIQRLQRRIEARAGKGMGPSGGDVA
jgi:alkylated DNA nucleotide flippase Atl1